MSSAIVMKVTSIEISENSWADIVKGAKGFAQKKKKFNPTVAEFVPRKKASDAPRTKQDFNFNVDAPEFSISELKMNALAKEFVPSMTPGLNPSTKEFVPPEHKLINKAADMQRLLLDCYTDDDDSSDEEMPVSLEQKSKQTNKKETGIVLPFRPPPGLAPPDAALNPFAPAFDPSTCVADGKICSPAPAFTSPINLGGFYSEDEADESPMSTPRSLSKTSIQDSTSAGESSDSETESWSGPHSP